VYAAHMDGKPSSGVFDITDGLPMPLLSSLRAFRNEGS